MPLGLRRPIPLAQTHRRSVLRALLWATVVCGAIFGGLNLHAGNPSLAIAELVMMAYAVTLLLVVRRAARLDLWILLFLMPFFGVMLYAIANPKVDVTVFSWVFLIPILSHLLLGRRIGALVAALFLLCAAVIFYLRYDGFGIDVLSAANIGLCAICIFGFSYVHELSRERTETELRRLASTDALTALPNRARFQEVLPRECLRAQSDGTAFALLLLDLDYFKRVNDTYGHEAGDMALRFVADFLRGRLRAADFVCRLGGEEFGILLSGASRAQAVRRGETLRQQLAAAPWRYRDEQVTLTMSLGVAEYGVDGRDLKTLFAAADERLYRAKAEGRNRLVA